VVAVLTAPVAEHLALMASRAPSVHNTQPWRLVVTPDGIDVRADRSRQLAVIDPLGRQLLMSCGALVHHLVVAARAMGMQEHVGLLPARDDMDLVARVGLEARRSGPQRSDVARAEAILRRSTDRRRFAEAVVTSGAMAPLRRAVEEQGAFLTPVRAEDRVTLDSLVEHAERELLSDEAYRQELASWVFDPAREGERDDGIPVSAVEPGTGRAEELPGRRFVPGGSSEHLLVEPEHPTVLVLSTAGDAPVDWVRCGLALSALLLEAEQHSLAAQPIGQVTDVAYERARLRQDLGLVGVPQLVLRIGRAVEAVGLQTPRRPVERVLSWAESPAHDGPAAASPVLHAGTGQG
jgi:nitroreductase